MTKTARFMANPAYISTFAMRAFVSVESGLSDSGAKLEYGFNPSAVSS